MRNREGGGGNDAGAGELNMAGQAAVLLLLWCTVCLECPRGGSALLAGAWGEGWRLARVEDALRFISGVLEACAGGCWVAFECCTCCSLITASLRGSDERFLRMAACRHESSSYWHDVPQLFEESLRHVIW